MWWRYMVYRTLHTTGAPRRPLSELCVALVSHANCHSRGHPPQRHHHTIGYSHSHRHINTHHPSSCNNASVVEGGVNNATVLHDLSLPRQSCCSVNTDSTKSFGQPTALTHPHLLKKDEVTPGITKHEFKRRRMQLMEGIRRKAECGGHHLVIIPSASKVYMSDNIPYPFRQNSDFLYLCGFLEPESVLILHNQSGADALNLPDHIAAVFVPKKDKHSELWDGPRSGIDGSIELLGVDQAYNMDDFESFLSKFAGSCKNFSLWCDINQLHHRSAKSAIQDLISNNRQRNFGNPTPIIHQLRLIKSDAEIKLMKESARIASDSLKSVIKASHPMVNESLLTAKMEFECKIRGADHLAFPPVVAGGDRANTIHYVKNDQQVLPGQMILMDAGCQYHGYVSDMTRTWPVNGKFTPAQKELYQAVLSIYEDMLKLCYEFLPLDEMFRRMSRLVGAKLQELCIIGNVSASQFAKLSYEHCPHHVSHYLGMDVHDTPQISRNINLKPGMVITIEPGIYIPEDCKHSPTRYHGLGVRIEDDVLITDSGPVVLTDNCPKQLNELEDLFGEVSNC